MRYLTTLFSPQVASMLFLVILVFLLLLWWGIVFWTYQDIKLRTKNQLLFTVALVVVICIPIAGVVFYFFIRPLTTLEEQQIADLEKLTLFKEIQDKSSCPFCGEPSEKDFLACPYCYKKIRTLCKNCEKVLELDWDLCPFCASRQTVQTAGISGIPDQQKFTKK